MSSSSSPGDPAAEAVLGAQLVSPGNAASPPLAAAGPSSGAVKLLAAGCIAALAAWFDMHFYFPFFIAPSPASSGGPGPTPPTAEETALMVASQFHNGMALMAIAGSLLALAFACCESGGRGVPSRVAHILIAVLLGGALGVAAGWCAESVAALEAPFRLGELGRGILLQVICWGLVFFGIVLGLSLGRWSLAGVTSLVVRGAVAAVLTAVAFPLVAAVVGILWPGGNGQGWIPDSAADQLAWFATAGICGALALAGQRRPPPAR